VRAIRRRKALTQRQLAETAGRNTATISLIESNHNIPHPDTIQKIADALDVPPEALTDPSWTATAPQEPPPSPVPPSVDWALVAPNKEFKGWIKTADAMDLHKFFVKASSYSQEISDKEVRSHLLWRAQLGINEFFKRFPVKEIIDQRPRASGERQGKSA
jgi:transcriptional regulator with XRE-family HTH domain